MIKTLSLSYVSGVGFLDQVTPVAARHMAQMQFGVFALLNIDLVEIIHPKLLIKIFLLIMSLLPLFIHGWCQQRVIWADNAGGR